MNQTGRTIYSTLDDLTATAQALLQYAGGQRVWLLEGTMGAGKTTLVKALCAQLGVRDNVTSPTFSLVHEYEAAAGAFIYHFDFYRIQREEEILDLDCTAYFACGRYCFVEWPEKLGALTPPTYCKIRFAVQSNGCRALHVTLVDDVYPSRIP